MAKITAIQAQKRKGRYNIFIDGQYRFPVSEEVLIKYQLHKGQEITNEQITNITNAEQIAKAYNRALDFLSYQLRSEKEIIDDLQKHEFVADKIELVLKKLRTNRLINDLEYAKSYVRTMKNTSDKGPRIIRQKLRQKGIGENDIDKALQEFSVEEQLENCFKIASKLNNKYRRESFKNKVQKIKQGLLTKGFSNPIIAQVIDQLDIAKDDDTEFNKLKVAGEKLLRRYDYHPNLKQKQKIKMSLYRKGFSLDEINRFIDEY